MLPAAAMAEAHALAEEADLMLCVGSSLEVFPVASLPGVTIESGGRVALVTQGPTAYDREAELKLSGDVAEELQAVVAAL
jgi:NAD-dependent deacetylase